MSQRGKRGQVTVFIIVALIIAVTIGGYFLISSQLGKDDSNGEFSDVYSYYSSCIEQYAQTGLSIAAIQGGKVDAGAYVPGSDYSPFGNQLLVSGVGVPYWFTVQGNGVLKEDVPTQSQIEDGLAQYIQSRLSDCSFDNYRNRGLSIAVGKPSVDVKIASDGVLVSVDSALSVSNENSSSSKQKFDVSVNSDFGRLYGEAKEIYAKQQETLFLENYSFDVLRLYAPVDGVEIQCAPKTWVARTVLSDLKTGLSDNLQSLRFSSDKGYFNVNIPVEDSAQVLYDANWPSRFEVYGNKGELLQADPVGNQAGMQAMGFCYVPYHFVYDMFFPVVVRINSDTNDFFQFPMVVMIDKNVPRQAYNYTIASDTTDTDDLCSFATQDTTLTARSSSGGVVSDAQVTYSCFDQECSVGTTDSNGKVHGTIPACINGVITATAEGYQDTSLIFSSNNASTAEFFMDKKYPVSLSLLVDGAQSNGQAFISLEGDHGIVQGVLPDSDTVQLSPGFYNVSIYQYGNASIRIPASTTKQCSDVPKGGLAGIFGATQEQCYDITIPETVIDRALTAGGQGELYLPEELLQTGKLTLTTESLPKPVGIDSLETNYALFDSNGVDVYYE